MMLNLDYFFIVRTSSKQWKSEKQKQMGTMNMFALESRK
jgi:hypothetical protein